MNPDDLLDHEPENDLATDLDATLRVLADELDVADTPDAGPVAGLLPPGMALDLIQSLGARWASESPDEVLGMLARAHLETGALLDEHAPGADPVDLLDA